jgi:hypothetical protein
LLKNPASRKTNGRTSLLPELRSAPPLQSRVTLPRGETCRARYERANSQRAVGLCSREAAGQSEHDGYAGCIVIGARTPWNRIVMRSDDHHLADTISAVNLGFDIPALLSRSGVPL